MSVDAQRLQDFPQITSVLFTVPILIVISVVLVWQIVGAASLASVAVLAILLPLNGVWMVIGDEGGEGAGCFVNA